MKKVFEQLQKIGRALMLPIAVLPVAALLLRFGSGDLLNIPFVMAAGDAIFSNLALLFAIGVAVGISSDNSGAAGLSGVVGYLVLTNATQTIDPEINMGVLAGIISGLVAGYLYNRFHDIRLPDVLGFFGGRRFVSIITGLVTIVLAVIFGYIWPPIQQVIYSFGEWIVNAGSIGVGIYGVLNQLLIPTGLHHILNSLVWFVFGEFTTAAGEVVSGDLTRFFAGDPTAGQFTAGFYAVFMFGMPGAALAMYHTAKKHQKKIAGGILLSTALTFFLTGIGEPFLFSFCFIAPLLYGIHALLSGVTLMVVNILGVRQGVTFSNGLIDYILTYGISEKAWITILAGIVCFVVYYFLFKFFILKFNIPTIGRGSIDDNEASLSILPESQRKQKTRKAKDGKDSKEELSLDTEKYIEYIGGASNIKEVESCITRLRLVLEDTEKINEPALKKMGVMGILKANKHNAQIVVGTQAQFIADDIKETLKNS